MTLLAVGFKDSEENGHERDGLYAECANKFLYNVLSFRRPFWDLKKNEDPG